MSLMSAAGDAFELGRSTRQGRIGAALAELSALGAKRKAC